MSERAYQQYLIQLLHEIFEGCIVLKNDPSYIQGFPDLLILHHDKWAALEVKARENAPTQPNQDYYVDRLGTMSFSAYIFPENEEEVLNALQRSFQPSRATRLPKRQ